jgi:hypothetical protein
MESTDIFEVVTFATPMSSYTDEPENYTQVNGIYGSEITPQFLGAVNNVAFSPLELQKAEQAYSSAQQEPRFFRVR